MKAIELQIEEWHITAQMRKERIKILEPYKDGFRNGEINAWEKVLALIKLGEVNDGQ